MAFLLSHPISMVLCRCIVCLKKWVGKTYSKILSRKYCFPWRYIIHLQSHSFKSYFDIPKYVYYWQLIIYESKWTELEQKYLHRYRLNTWFPFSCDPNLWNVYVHILKGGTSTSLALRFLCWWLMFLAYMEFIFSIWCSYYSEGRNTV